MPVDRKTATKMRITWRTTHQHTQTTVSDARMGQLAQKPSGTAAAQTQACLRGHHTTETTRTGTHARTSHHGAPAARLATGAQRLLTWQLVSFVMSCCAESRMSLPDVLGACLSASDARRTEHNEEGRYGQRESSRNASTGVLSLMFSGYSSAHTNTRRSAHIVAPAQRPAEQSRAKSGNALAMNLFLVCWMPMTMEANRLSLFLKQKSVTVYRTLPA